MARQKTGFTYYQVDTNRYQDRRIRKLLRKFRGGVGIAVYDCILCEVFRDKGHSLVWDEDTAFDVSEILGVTEKTIKEVVKSCADIGLFDSSMLNKGIITSASIQERYKAMCAWTKRQVHIPNEISLLAQNSEECGKNSEEYPQNSEECRQISEKCTTNLIKVNLSKDNINSPTQSVCENNAHTHTLTREEERFNSFIGWSKTYAPLSLAFTEPLNLEHFIWLYRKYGAERMKECASDLHNKEAYKANRNAMNVWKRWIEKVHLPASEEAKIYRRNA